MVKLFFSIAQASSLYGLLRPYTMDSEAEDSYNLLCAALDRVKSNMIKKLIAAAEARRQYMTLKFTVAESYALRIVLSNYGWIDPLSDSTRIYVLTAIDSKLP